MFVDERHPELLALAFNENAGSSIGIVGRENVERELLQVDMQP